MAFNSWLSTDTCPYGAPQILVTLKSFFHRKGVGANTWYSLSGKLAALDAAGEWLYDGAGLYLWTPFGDNPANHTVEAKRRVFAFDLSGTSYVTIKGFNIFASSIRTNMLSSHNVIDGIHAKYVSHFAVGDSSTQTLNPPWDTGILLHGNDNVLQNSEIACSAGNGVDLLGSNHKVSLLSG